MESIEIGPVLQECIDVAKYNFMRTLSAQQNKHNHEEYPDKKTRVRQMRHGTINEGEVASLQQVI